MKILHTSYVSLDKKELISFWKLSAPGYGPKPPGIPEISEISGNSYVLNSYREFPEISEFPGIPTEIPGNS